MTNVKKLYTPMGYMREKIPHTNKPSYYLTMIADSELSNIEFLKQLHNYTTQLEKTVGVTAYSKFKNLKIP